VILICISFIVNHAEHLCKCYLPPVYPLFPTFFLFIYLFLQSRHSTNWVSPPILFVWLFWRLRGRVSQTICLGWPRTVILPSIVSDWHLALFSPLSNSIVYIITIGFWNFFKNSRSSLLLLIWLAKLAKNFFFLSWLSLMCQVIFLWILFIFLVVLGLNSGSDAC
jgi:hypothetical protein